MKIISAQFDNYRSFGAPVHFEFTRNIVGLIGQNGMGKTNALEALSRMRFFTDEVMNVIPESAINQNTEEVPEIVIHARLDDRDIKELGAAAIGKKEDLNTSYRFKYDALRKRTQMSFTGFFFNRMQDNPSIADLHKDLFALAGHLGESKRQLNSTEYHDLIEALIGYETHYIPRLHAIIKWALQTLPSHVGPEWKDKVLPLLRTFESVLQDLYKAFAKVSPQIYLFKDAAEFPNAYNIDEVQAWDQRLSENSRIALDRYLRAIDVSRNELVQAFKDNDLRIRERLRGRIIKRTRDVIRGFNKYYKNNTAGIELNVEFDGSMLRFAVGNNNDDGGVPWSDASAGVRWYLSAYMEICKALQSRNVLLLIDEPAMHLHVKAQQEALKLLQELANETRFIVYTTHSPYMIDKTRLGDVRAVVKEGKVSTIRTLQQVGGIPSRLEVLTPVCHALGYEMSASLVPNASKLNLVTEGVTDSLYVNAMMDVLKFFSEEERPFVLSSQGASSIQNIAAIFVGWGVPFCTLLDRDNSGKEAAKVIKERFGEDYILFVSKTDGEAIENLIADEDVEATCPEEMDIRQFRNSKTLRAERFAAAVGEGWRPSKKTCDAFDELFNCLDAYLNQIGER